MQGRKSIIFFLTFLYTAVVLHNSIYHHHHDTVEQAALHHQLEHQDHAHPHGESSGHDHTPHFVHAHDFGTSIKTSFSRPAIEKIITVSPANVYTIFTTSASELFIAENNYVPDASPPLCGGFYRYRSFRGPPSSIA